MYEKEPRYSEQILPFPWPSVNPLSPNIHIQILQTCLHTFPYRMSQEYLINDQSIFSLVIILLILIT